MLNSVVLSELAAGRPIQVFGKGKSMEPRIKEGEARTIVPINERHQLKPNDIVFVRIKRNRFVTHQIKAINDDDTFIISYEAGKIDAVVKESAIYGVVERVGFDESFKGLTIYE